MKFTKRLNVTFYSIVPSPYQKDLFYELSNYPEINLKVYYLESVSPDSPWPEKELQSYERVLPGGYVSWGSSRFHCNWHIPSLAETDIVVLNGYQSLTVQLILYYWAKQIPCIFWGEKMVASSSGLKGQLQKLLARALEHCSAIVAIGSKAEIDYRKRFPNKSIFNIPYYCDLSSFSVTRTPENRNSLTILFCGQMIRRKGIDLLLQAFDRIVQQGMKVRLLLVGREAELPQMIKSISAQARQKIEYAGFQAPDDLHLFFHQADLFVLPSRYDGWGVVVNQALGAGLPIICSDQVSGAYDLVECGVNGDIFPSEDLDGLTNLLKLYLGNSTLLRSASQASLTKAELWSPKVGAERWLKIFTKLTKSSSFS